MSPPPPIYTFTDALREFKTERVHDIYEPCCACWRNFGEKDEPSDPNETPCHAVRLFPCHHIVGHHCLDEMKRRGMSNCLICRTQLTVLPMHSMRFVRWLSSDKTLRLVIDIVVGYIRKYETSTAFETLLRSFLAGNMSRRDARTLWWIHIRTWIAIITRFTMYVVRNVFIIRILYAVFMRIFKDTSIWEPMSRFLAFWNFPLTPRGYIESSFDHAINLLIAVVFFGFISTLLFAFFIGVIVWAGTERSYFVTSQRHGQGQQGATSTTANPLMIEESEVEGPWNAANITSIQNHVPSSGLLY